MSPFMFIKKSYRLLFYKEQVPDPHFFQGSDPDPVFFQRSDLVRSEIIWIRNTANYFATFGLISHSELERSDENRSDKNRSDKSIIRTSFVFGAISFGEQGIRR
jgi:hypothetical protein